MSVRARLRLAACMQGRIVIVACCSFVFIYTYECVFINYLCIISLYIVKRVSQFKHTNQICAAQKDAQHFYCLLYQVSESIVVEIGPRNLLNFDTSKTRLNYSQVRSKNRSQEP